MGQQIQIDFCRFVIVSWTT